MLLGPTDWPNRTVLSNGAPGTSNAVERDDELHMVTHSLADVTNNLVDGARTPVVAAIATLIASSRSTM
jgi:hypothetical protein